MPKKNQRVGWDKARLLGIESIIRNRKLQGIGPHGMLNQSDQPTQFVYLSHMDSHL
jgi:hypothetical protein